MCLVVDQNLSASSISTKKLKTAPDLHVPSGWPNQIKGQQKKLNEKEQKKCVAKRLSQRKQKTLGFKPTIYHLQSWRSAHFAKAAQVEVCWINPFIKAELLCCLFVVYGAVLKKIPVS